MAHTAPSARGPPGSHPISDSVLSRIPANKDLPIACPAGTHIPKQENKESDWCPVHVPDWQLTHPQQLSLCWQSPPGNTLQGPSALLHRGHREDVPARGRHPRGPWRIRNTGTWVWAKGCHSHPASTGEDPQEKPIRWSGGPSSSTEPMRKGEGDPHGLGAQMHRWDLRLGGGSPGPATSQALVGKSFWPQHLVSYGCLSPSPTAARRFYLFLREKE